MAEESLLEVLLKTGVRLLGIGCFALQQVIHYYALGQPNDMYHALWEKYGDLRDIVMVGESVVAGTLGFIGALHLTTHENYENFWEVFRKK